MFLVCFLWGYSFNVLKHSLHTSDHHYWTARPSLPCSAQLCHDSSHTPLWPPGCERSEGFSQHKNGSRWGALGNQKDWGRTESSGRKQGLWLQGVKPMLTGLPDGCLLPGPPWHLLPWKGAEKAGDWQGTPGKKADAGVTVIPAGWGIRPPFYPRRPQHRQPLQYYKGLRLWEKRH